jgi:hypothetical protein
MHCSAGFGRSASDLIGAVLRPRVFGANTGDVWKGPGGVGRGRGQRGVSEPTGNGRPRGKGAPMRRIAIALGVALSDLILE